MFAQSRHIISTNGLPDLLSVHKDLRRKQVYTITNAPHLRILKGSTKNCLFQDKIDCRTDLKKFYKFVFQFHTNIGRTESPTYTTSDGPPIPAPSTRSIVCLHSVSTSVSVLTHHQNTSDFTDYWAGMNHSLQASDYWRGQFGVSDL